MNSVIELKRIIKKYLKSTKIARKQDIFGHKTWLSNWNPGCLVLPNEISKKIKINNWNVKKCWQYYLKKKNKAKIMFYEANILVFDR